MMVPLLFFFGSILHYISEVRLRELINEQTAGGMVEG